MEGFPSGQREQTVNLSSMTSVVRIHHLPPKRKDIPKGMSFFALAEGRWRIRKPALRNVPVARFNRRGFAAAKRIHHRTGRHACGSAVMGLHQPIPAGTRPIRRKERSFNDEIYLHGPFVTIYCHLRRYLVGAHTAVGVFALQDIWCKTMSLNKQALRFHHLTKPERPFIILI